MILYDSNPVVDGESSALQGPFLTLIHLSSQHFVGGLYQACYQMPWYGQL